jgi:hypothetical protein
MHNIHKARRPACCIIVGLDARTKGPSPLVGESDISPENELSSKYISGIINLYTYILKKIVSLI